MIGNLKPLEIVLIVLVILLLFGAKKLPDMARSLGKSARILKSEAKQMKKDGGDEGEGGASADSQQTAPKTIQAAPGDVASSRPVSEPAEQKQQNPS
ncbi:sec-independent protein translocase protein TatA [Streptomyces sp. Amel2xB2]|uniref:Sec-independent protein translocase subunit TatA n=1 Tax=Streptomyces sp. Amel2xB2 TaxID=1305829 RepID=UPI000DB998AA|nr:Sec-independent protein translocase subunit TatA [Streptomyces sp. Amel2xB2]RAJ60061.1 sec-independent protein translocase protein TatA [Streptomyces sp. Amel2xB2]